MSQILQFSHQDLTILKEETVYKGHFELKKIHFKHKLFNGEVLQLRPKGKNSQVLTDAVNQRGEPIQTLPLGFYLRKSFTREILQNFLRERL